MNHNSLFDETITFDKLARYQRGREVGSSDDATSAKTSSTYAEMVEEVERASEIILQTQTKLFQTQEELRIYRDEARIANDRVKRLEERLSNQDKELVRLHGENSLLLDEGQDLRDTVKQLEEDVRERDAGMARPQLEQRLRKAVELLKKDLESTKEKQQTSAKDAIIQKSMVAKLEANNKSLKGFLSQLEKKENESQEDLNTCKSQLRQATEESTKMIEEVAELREELQRTRKVADGREKIMHKEIEDKVKEKIRLEVRESVTKQVTARVTRQVKADMKLGHDKEINALREQFKKVFKENEQLAHKVIESKADVERSKQLEDVIPNLKYEISRLLSLLDNVKKDHEIAVSELETCYNKKIQIFKEEAAKEKWAHATEMRKQLSRERDREVTEFTQRIDALAKQTDRMLRNADKEKETYANQARMRAIEEKEKEITALKEQLATRTRESEELMSDAARDKEAYGQKIRDQFQEEKRRESYKYTYRIEVLNSEKENLQKRINSYEEELEWAWKEHEEKSDQLKECQSDLKILEDDIFKLKRKNQNLSTLAERYKLDYEEVSAEYNQSKAKFKDALLQSEQRSHIVKGELKQAESMLSQIRNLSVKDGDQQSNTMEPQPSHSELAAENKKLKEKVDNLTSLVHTLRRESLEIEMGRLKEETVTDSEKKEQRTGGIGGIGANPKHLEELQEENVALKRRVDELTPLLEENKMKNEQLHQKSQEYQSNLEISKEEVKRLKQQLEDTTSLLSNYRCENAEATKELERTLRSFEDALTVASEDDNTVQLNSEIQSLERLLERYKVTNAEVQLENIVHATETSSIEKKETKIVNRNTLRPALPGEECDGCIDLRKKIVDLTYLLDKSRNDLSQSSQELENTRQNLVTESEKARHLHEQVQSLSRMRQSNEAIQSKKNQELQESQEVLPHLLRQIEELKQEINRRQDDYDNSLTVEKTWKDKLEKELFAVRKNYTGARDRADRLEAELQEYVDRHTQAQSKADRLDGELQEFLIRESKGMERANRLEAELQAFIAKHDEAKERADRCETKLKLLLSEDVETKLRRAEILEHEVKELIGKHAEVQQRTDKIKTEMQEMLASHEEERKKFERSEAELKDIIARHFKAQARVEQLEVELQKYQADSSGSDTQQKHLEEELSKLRNENRDISEELKQSKKLFKEELWKSEQEIFELQKQRAGANSLITNSQEEPDNPTSDDKELDASEATKGRSMDKANQPNEDLQNLMAKHDAVSNELKHSKRLFKEELMKSEQEKFDLEKKLEEMNSLVAKNEDEFSKSTEELIQAKRQLELALVTSEAHARQKVLELENMLRNSQSENEQLQVQAEDLKMKLQDHSVYEKQELQEKMESIQLLLDSTRREHERTKEDLEHSIELFKEALAAWRDESKALNEELRTLRQNSSDSARMHLARSHDSKDLGEDSAQSLSHQPVAMSINDSTVQSIVGGAILNEKTKSCQEPKRFGYADFSNASERDYNSSSESSHTSLVNKWRQETHKLIEEVEAAHTQRRNNKSTDNSNDTLKTDPSGNSSSSNSTSVSRSSRYSLKASTQSDLESVDSDEEMLREKFGIHIEEWNKTLDDFSSSIFGGSSHSPNRYSTETEKSRLSSEGSASRSERSILRNASGTSSSNVKKSVTWNDTVEELSFETEDEILETGPSNSSFSFQHDFEAETRDTDQEEDRRSQETATVEGGICEVATARCPSGDERSSGGGSPAGEDRTPSDDIDYSLSQSSHTATDGVVIFKASDIIDHEGKAALNQRNDDDSTLDWHLQSSGGSSSASRQFEISVSDHQGEDCQAAGWRSKDPASLSTDEKALNMTTPAVVADKPEQSAQCTTVTGDATTNKLAGSSPNSSSHSERMQHTAKIAPLHSNTSSSSHSTRAYDPVQTAISNNSSTGSIFSSHSARAPHNSASQSSSSSSHSASTLTPENISKKILHGGATQIKLAASHSAEELLHTEVVNSDTVPEDATTNKLFMTSSSSSDSERARIREQTVQRKPKFQGSVILNKILASSSSSSYSGRASRSTPHMHPSGFVESRNDHPSGLVELTRKSARAQVSSSSSSSMTSSPCPSSFSTSFSSSSTSSHSSRKMLVDMTGEVKVSLPPPPTTSLKPIGEETPDLARSGPPTKTSIYESTQTKGSKGKFKKKGLRRFIRKKRATIKKGTKSTEGDEPESSALPEPGSSSKADDELESKREPPEPAKMLLG